MSRYYQSYLSEISDRIEDAEAGRIKLCEQVFDSSVALTTDYEEAKAKISRLVGELDDACERVGLSEGRLADPTKLVESSCAAEAVQKEVAREELKEKSFEVERLNKRIKELDARVTELDDCVAELAKEGQCGAVWG
ncbi:uncharacterized protein G2W53_021863 [Senna tora]|uniref:Uncharacterized protein n=1 Tax=Senna tora TaxID=362788 RepID=A0A834TM13_9FABA|nr:uncharacterized protein G2W53_021863 [Senna tora]